MKETIAIWLSLLAVPFGLAAASVEVEGGLVVCIGADALESVSEDWQKAGTVFQGLESSAAKVAGLRKRIQAAGCYGKVSVVLFDGEKLPYIDNLVSEIVVGSGAKVPEDELLRVLAPLGSLFADGKKTVKSWPPDIDEWTHYLHGPDNNAVAQDSVVAPPKGMQWLNYPLWDRAHSTLPSLSAMVSAKGRIFSIEDSAPISLPVMPGKYRLVARDAFNGIVLWTHPCAGWENITHHMKGAAPQLNRRAVAIGDTLYATPGISAPVVAFDAATGKTRRRYEGTEGTREIIYYEGVLYLAAGDQSKNYGYEKEGIQFPSRMAFGEKHYTPRARYLTAQELLEQERRHSIMAIEAATGRRVWEISGDRTRDYEGLSIAVDGERMVYQYGKKLVCLERSTGKELWAVPVETSWLARNSRWAGGNASIVVKAGTVYRAESNGLFAYSLEDGKELWRSKGRVPFGYVSSPDLLIANGAVWVQGSHAGLDPATGEAIQGRGKTRGGPMGHDRCHRNKATDRYIITSTSGGNDFSYLDSTNSLSHPWARNTCSLGGMPCNGLLYATPHACACVNETTLNGFWALTGAREANLEAGKLDNLLVKGTAYGRVSLGSHPAGSWPTYRKDATRSALAQTDVPSKLEVLWQAKLPAGTTQPTIAGGRLYIASVDEHTVYGMDGNSGKVLWRYSAGGRVDTPPTYYDGLVLFGARDGWVYCLESSRGELVWKFRAAPAGEHLACAFGQVESLWPVHGSVLMLNGVAYVSAGRSTFLDGGIILYALDPLAGTKLHARVLTGPYEDGGEPIIKTIKRTAIRGNKNEILVTDGKLIYLSHWAFTPELEQVDDIEKHRDHLLTGSFMLDDAKHHRSYWTLSRIVPSSRRVPQVAIPDGDLIAVEKDRVYGVRVIRTAADAQSINPAEAGLSFFCMTRHEKEPSRARPRKPRPGKKKRPQYVPVSKYDYRENWATGIHVNPDAMLLDEDNVFVAGTPNVFPEDDIFKAVEGRMGGLLVIASKEDGKEVARYELADVPTWDGMSAADGKLFVSLKNGALVCFGEKE